MPEIVWVPLIIVIVWGGLFAFSVGSGAVPFNWFAVYREENPLLFWILVGLFGAVAINGLVLAVYGAWVTYAAPLFS